MFDLETLQIAALNPMVASPDGRITVTNLVAYLENRLGSSEDLSKSAQLVEGQSFREDMRELLSLEPNSGSLVDCDFAKFGSTGGQVQITMTGRRLIGQ